MRTPRKPCLHRTAYACSAVRHDGQRYRHPIICRDCGASTVHDGLSGWLVVWSDPLAKQKSEWMYREGEHFAILAGPSGDMAMLRKACDEADLRETLTRSEALHRNILSKLPGDFPAEGLQSQAELHRAEVEKIRTRFAQV